MSDTLQEGPLIDWGIWPEGEDDMPSQMLTEVAIYLDNGDTPADFEERYGEVVASMEQVLDEQQQLAMAGFLNAVSDALQQGELDYGQVAGFTFWLEYNMSQPDIPSDEDIQDVISQWIDQYATTHNLPVPVGRTTPGPLVQGLIESANAASPLPNPPQAAPALPSPSQGQQAVVRGTTTIKPSTVTGGTPEGTSAAQVSAALAVTAVDILQVVAHVFDDMLPNMAPGQVPDALGQLNRAINVLENQVSRLMSDVDVNVKGSMGAQLNGALQTLNGLAQEVNILAEDVAEKASSALGTHVNNNSTAIAGVTATVAGLVGSAIPELASGLGSLTGQVGQLEDTVTNKVQPELDKVADQTATNTDTLSGTDKDCLDALCDAEGNVINPITKGGATPSLLGKLGSLLGLGWAVGTLFSLMDAIETLFQAPLALQAVVADVEQLASWAESAAISIEQELPFAPTT